VDTGGLVAAPADAGVEYFDDVTAAVGAVFDSENNFVSLSAVGELLVLSLD
jgi:hypothetical protein